MADETCRGYEVDGEPVVVRGGESLNEQDQIALADLVRAAKALFDQDPNAGVAQELIAAARLASWCIPDGMTGARFRMVDGTEVKQRLKEAVQAAREALTQTPSKDVGDPRQLAMQALNAKFDCGNGTIALEPVELRHLTATKATGPGLLDWQKLTLGEIADCLAEAGLLVAPREPR